MQEEICDLKKNKFEKKLITPLFQIFFIICSSLLFSFNIYKKISVWECHDPIPSIETINPTTYAMFGGFAQTIHVGFHIEDFNNFDTIENTFTIAGNLWFIFNPNTLSLATLGKFSFARAEMLERHAPLITIKNKKIIAQYPIKIKFKTPLDLQGFPFDNHTIILELNHLFFSPTEIIFEAHLQAFNIREKSTSGWNIIDNQTSSGYTKIDLIDDSFYYPTALFSINVMRSGIQYPLTLFLPLLMIFFIMLFTFSIPKEETRITLTASSVTGILAYRFVIANLSPQAGYFMISDYFFFLFLGLAIVIFFVNILDIFYANISINIKKLIIILFHMSLNIIITYLLHG